MTISSLINAAGLSNHSTHHPALHWKAKNSRNQWDIPLHVRCQDFKKTGLGKIPEHRAVGMGRMKPDFRHRCEETAFAFHWSVLPGERKDEGNEAPKSSEGQSSSSQLVPSIPLLRREFSPFLWSRWLLPTGSELLLCLLTYHIQPTYTN